MTTIIKRAKLNFCRKLGKAQNWAIFLAQSSSQTKTTARRAYENQTGPQVQDTLYFGVRWANISRMIRFPHPPPQKSESKVQTHIKTRKPAARPSLSPPQDDRRLSLLLLPLPHPPIIPFPSPALPQPHACHPLSRFVARNDDGADLHHDQARRRPAGPGNLICSCCSLLISLFSIEEWVWLDVCSRGHVLIWFGLFGAQFLTGGSLCCADRRHHQSVREERVLPQG